VEQATARDYLEQGIRKLNDQGKDWKRRQEYFEGKQDLPYAPQGVNAEYQALRKMAPANVLGLAMKAPCQRLAAEGFRTGREGKADLAAWNEIWQPNSLDSRQVIVYQQMMVHGRGIMSVSPNKADAKSPKIRVENSKRVWIEPDPEDPWESLYAVKTFTEDRPTASALLLPSGTTYGALQTAYVYDSMSWMKFTRHGETPWEFADQGAHNLGSVPFVPFDFNVDADGNPRSSLVELMPAQDAVNTVRFNTLLAMQFSAFRQRGVTGFDPVVRDAKGNILVKRDAEGKPILDANGMQQPIVSSPGRVGVDRMLVFPGAETKIWDLQESNLANYIVVWKQLLGDFFAAAQVPPQYAMDKMANLTGDGMAGAESTFQSLIKDLQTAAGESLERVMRLANKARSEPFPDLASEVIWADTEVRSFAQIVDAAQKLVATGMAPRDAWALLPGATPPKVEAWAEHAAQWLVSQDQAMREIADKMAFEDA
jgi:hypothetical protein